MSHEFNDAEMYPCDICGNAYPIDMMYQLEDGRIICQDCLDEMDCQ